MFLRQVSGVMLSRFGRPQAPALSWHIHGFRTTFAVDLLTHAASVETVALLGHSPAIVLKH
jgi:hypothetical protein